MIIPAMIVPAMVSPLQVTVRKRQSIGRGIVVRIVTIRITTMVSAANGTDTPANAQKQDGSQRDSDNGFHDRLLFSIIAEGTL
jgi:hypothetical protein